MLRHVALVRADVSEEHSASFIRVTRIGELGTTLAATSIRHTLLLRFLQEPHGVTSQKTPFFTVTAMNTPNLTALDVSLYSASDVPCAVACSIKLSKRHGAVAAAL
jgi:hypothetical protein